MRNDKPLLKHVKRAFEHCFQRNALQNKIFVSLKCDALIIFLLTIFWNHHCVSFCPVSFIILGTYLDRTLAQETILFSSMLPPAACSIHSWPHTTTSFILVEEFGVLLGKPDQGRKGVLSGECQIHFYTGHFRGLVCKAASQTGGWGQGAAKVVERAQSVCTTKVSSNCSSRQIQKYIWCCDCNRCDNFRTR